MNDDKIFQEIHNQEIEVEQWLLGYKCRIDNIVTLQTVIEQRRFAQMLHSVKTEAYS